ncbi:MAG: hypothetical protein VXZ72_03180 [Chlamydiota bacterium]|nr:hypothetical protein [Chlamydiota bacterium]
MAIGNSDVRECMKNTLHLVTIDALLDQIIEEKEVSGAPVPGLWLSYKSMEMLRKLTTGFTGDPHERLRTLYDLIESRRCPHESHSKTAPYEGLRWVVACHLGLDKSTSTDNWYDGRRKIDEWMRQLVPELESLLYYLGQIKYLDPVYVGTIDERRKSELVEAVRARNLESDAADRTPAEESGWEIMEMAT